MEKYSNKDNINVFSLCPRCNQGMIANTRYCKNCGFDFQSIDNNEDKKLNFGMEVPSSGEVIKEKNKTTYSQKITKPIERFNKINNVLFLLIGILSILMLILPLFSNGNFWSYYERISLGEGHYNFNIDESLKISSITNVISLISPLLKYPQNFDQIIGYSDIMFFYELIVVMLVFAILISGIVLIVVGIKSIFFNYNSRHHRMIIGTILSLSSILVFALNCFGVGPIILSVVCFLTLIYFYISGVLTKEKKFMLKHLIHKSISLSLLLMLLFLTSFELINLNVDIGASLFNSYIREEIPTHIESCRGLFVEFMQFVQCTGGDDIFVDVTFKLNVACFVLHFAYMIMLVLSYVGLLMSFSKQSMKYPIVKTIVSSVLFYGFALVLIIFNELVNDAVFQQYLSYNNASLEILSDIEISSLKETYRIFVLKPGMIISMIANLPILVYIAIARNFCLNKTFY